MAIDKRDRVVAMLNRALESVDPISYSDFNTIMSITDEGHIEQEFPEFKIKVTADGSLKTSTIAMLASITEVLCGSRLNVTLNEDRTIKCFGWHQIKEPDKVLSDKIQIAGKTFVVTGKLPEVRSQIEARITSRGGTCHPRIVKGIDYLICGKDVGQTKMNKAKSYGITMIDWHNFQPSLDSI
jgi:NAD-dependent DNA ligase